MGDIEIFGQDKISGQIQRYAVIEGPNSTIDIVNPADPQSKTRIQAAKMSVFFDEKTGKTAKLEADGNVRFSGTRPAQGKNGIRTFLVTGTKAIYHKSDGRLVMEGPVTFDGAQAAEDGKSKKTVKGTARLATYNENTEVLTLEGGFKALYSDPSTIVEPGAPIIGDKLTANLSKNPIEYEILSDKSYSHISFTPVEKPKKKEQK